MSGQVAVAIGLAGALILTAVGAMLAARLASPRVIQARCAGCRHGRAAPGGSLCSDCSARFRRDDELQRAE